MIKNSLLACLTTVALLAGCREQDLSEQGLLQGVIEIEERVLSFEVAGRVQEVRVQRGDVVKAGASIAKLDDTLEQLQQAARESEVAIAEAQLELLRAGARPEEIRSAAAQVRAAKAVEEQLAKNLERERGLSGRGVTPQAVVDDLDAQLNRARAERQALEQRLSLTQKGARAQEIKTAEARVESLSVGTRLAEARIVRHRLEAPHAGVVLDVHVKPGEVIGPATPIATLGDTAQPYVDVFVPEGELAGIRVGARASLRLDGTSKTYRGRVEHLADRAEFTPRFVFSERERPNLVFRVRVRIEDSRRELHAGLPAFVDIRGGASK